MGRPRKIKPARVYRASNPHRQYTSAERVAKVAQIALVVASGLSIEAACGKCGIADKTLRNWYADNPEFRDRVNDALDVSLAIRRSIAEGVVRDCMTKSDDENIRLKAATFFLETQCGWQRGPSVAVTVGDRKRHVIHTDMTEIRARADANAAAQKLIEETAVPSA